MRCDEKCAYSMRAAIKNHEAKENHNTNTSV